MRGKATNKRTRKTTINSSKGSWHFSLFRRLKATTTVPTVNWQRNAKRLRKRINFEAEVIALNALKNFFSLFQPIPTNKISKSRFSFLLGVAERLAADLKKEMNCYWLWNYYLNVAEFVAGVSNSDSDSFLQRKYAKF